MADTDLLIVGGGPAALSCAITARARNLSVLVVTADSTAGWLYRAQQIANYPGLPGVSGKDLLEKFRLQAESLGARIRHGVVRQLQPAGQEYMALIDNDIVTARSVALCIGAARPRLLPGEEELLGQGVSWCGTCDGMFYRGKQVAVLSGWSGALEDIRFLKKICAGVDVYRLVPHELEGEPVLEEHPVSLERKDGKILLTLREGSVRAYDGVFVFRPAVAPDRLLPGLELDGAFIRTDRRMAANLPRVYAAGDCTGLPLQVAKAVGEGNICAVSAA